MSESDLGPVVDPAPSVQFNASTEKNRKNYEKKHTLTVKVFLSTKTYPVITGIHIIV